MLVDSYYVLKDFDGYKKAHAEANEMYKDEERWLEASITNIAKSGYFSSDRTISQYANEIWNIKKIK